MHAPSLSLTMAVLIGGLLLGQPRDGKKQSKSPHTDVRKRPASERRAAGHSVRRAAAQDNGRGATLYRRSCATCHGSDGRGAQSRDTMPEIPDFTSEKWQAARSNARLAASIRHGRGDTMPPFDDKLTVEQTADVVAHVRAFGAGNATPGNDRAGDFDARFRRLQEEWDELEKQVRELSEKRNGRRR